MASRPFLFLYREAVREMGATLICHRFCSCVAIEPWEAVVLAHMRVIVGFGMSAAVLYDCTVAICVPRPRDQRGLRLVACGALHFWAQRYRA